MESTLIRIVIKNEEAMEMLGAHLAQAVGKTGVSLALKGTLGAGKTTLARGFLRERGYQGTVKSPTFTLIEPYDLLEGVIYHFDLYRLVDSEELELLGIRDYFVPDAICLIEWPERGAGVLPELDLQVLINYCEEGRTVQIEATSPQGVDVLEMLNTLPDFRGLKNEFSASPRSCGSILSR
ncbi:N(6)-L-threonylcarbamoyladenine synthase, TsaE subunit [Gammaproteobacteria bacterium]